MPKKVVPINANRVVAANLAAARRLRGWTQEEAAARLEPYLGERWSKATWSAAERSFDGAHPRQFDATDIVAFSRAFGLPIGWFFVPTDESKYVETALIHAHFGESDGRSSYQDRFASLLEALHQPAVDPVLSVFKEVFDRLTERQARRSLDDIFASLSHLSEVVNAVREALPANEGEDQ